MNEAWRRFAVCNGGTPAGQVGVGANYLDACRSAEERGDRSARNARLGIESVMRREQSHFSCEYPCHSSQAQRWFMMQVSRVPESGHVVIAHEDITARKQAEDALRLSHDDLERSVAERTAQLEQRNLQLHREIAERERVQLQLRQAAKVFDTTIEAILIADGQHNIVAVNRAFSRITGYEPGEVIGRNPRVFSSGRHTQEFYEALWKSLNETGQWQGEITNRRKNGEIYPAWESITVNKDAEGKVIDYVSAMSDISALKQTEERLIYLAYHDPLTGLANRLMFKTQLDQAIEHARRHPALLGLLFIDMDNFKFINDSLGHLVGDTYLKTIAERLRTVVRAEDVVARLGGDEFAVMLSELSHGQDAGMLADKLVRILAQGVQIGGHEVSSSASIGISIYPDDGHNSETLLKAADSAMYQAKGEGRNSFRFYRPEMSARAFRRMTLESSLRHALSQKELGLCYQPLVDVATLRCVGLEALLRWHSPEHGLIMPEAFIPLAEETRLIQPIGNWVLGQSLQDLAVWRDQGLSPLRLAVNVSWRQFNDGQFVASLCRTLESFGLEARHIELDLEITESALQTNGRAVKDLLRLREQGVRVMIDDFGTGYSSLSQLKELPVDGIKIDKMFLRNFEHDAHSRAIIRAVIALGRGLNLDLVGEGVETRAQLDFLRAEGCVLAQGFFFGKPVPADQVPALLAGLKIAAAPRFAQEIMLE